MAEKKKLCAPHRPSAERKWNEEMQAHLIHCLDCDAYLTEAGHWWFPAGTVTGRIKSDQPNVSNAPDTEDKMLDEKRLQVEQLMRGLEKNPLKPFEMSREEFWKRLHFLGEFDPVVRAMLHQKCYTDFDEDKHLIGMLYIMIKYLVEGNQSLVKKFSDLKQRTIVDRVFFETKDQDDGSQKANG